MSDFNIDLHSHCAMKPFGNSFDKLHVQSSKTNAKNNLWYYQPPNMLQKIVNFLAGLASFRQSDFTSMHYGNIQVVMAALYSVEKGFVLNNLGNNEASDFIDSMISALSPHRIDELQKADKYFPYLEKEYEFYLSLNNALVNIDGQKCRYKLTKNFNDIQAIIDENKHSEIKTLAVVFSLEGCHAFNTGLGKPVNESEVLSNIETMRTWVHPPLVITIAHHFYNDICAHSQSFTGIMAKALDQKYGMQDSPLDGITTFGWKVIDSLLDKSKGKRFLIDIKHMSPLSRNQYFAHLDLKYSSENIPVIVTHGAANGLLSYNNPIQANPLLSPMLKDMGINFYDNEILRVATTRGIFGIQMDERRVASTSALKESGGHVGRKNILYYKSKLIWNNIQYIAELLDKNGMFAWGIQAIGTDYDGMIDPLNGYWTSEDLNPLADYLLKHAFNYMNSDQGKNLATANKITAEQIINRVMQTNALEFLERYYI